MEVQKNILNAIFFRSKIPGLNISRIYSIPIFSDQKSPDEICQESLPCQREVRFRQPENFAAVFLSKIATEYDDLYISRILQRTKNIAMVGLSDNWNRPSYFVAKYLLDRGYKIFAINPKKAGDKILGINVYPSFESIKDKIDMVDIFRNSEAALSITQAALKIKPQTIWMQIGVKNDKAAKIA